MRRLLLILAGLGIGLFPAAAMADFAPSDRATLQCVNVATEACPGSSYVTFDSFTDSPVPDRPNNGDERAFFEAKDASSSTTTQDGFNDNLSVRDGERIMLRVYIHNDANPATAGVDTTAHNTVVQIQLPSVAASPYTATASIRADNAVPHEITDTLTLSGSAPFSLTFDTASPVNMTARTNGVGDFVTHQANGVTLGSNNLVVNLGDWPGGFANHGVLTAMAVVHNAAPVVVQPVGFMCTEFDLNTSNNVFTAHTNPQNANANVSSYVFTTKDANGNVVDTQTVNTNAQTAVYNFNQTTPGTYTVSVVANSDKGSTLTSACSRQITVAAPAQVSAASTSSTSPTLPKTGAGDILGVFTGASTLGAAAHYIVKRRR